eukprot:TRINITY_DN4920_c0_g1_i1.p1 TRINITY_DN4920_c0_g1~~TRINITY_DN4920_c0_g1_i1.p1  ORF type:complete len:190 (-),score=43.43 TRINITY_DN4920_c0_g1_i1:55-624(-)
MLVNTSELELSSECADVVSSWMSEIQSSSDEDDNAEPIVRPARLGIGAKFLAHSKSAEGQAAKVEKVLRQTIQRDQQQKQWDKSGGRDWKHQELGPGDAESSEESEDEGRGAGSKTRTVAVNAKAQALAQFQKQAARLPSTKDKATKNRETVSYTHLTLPTKRIVSISVGDVSLKKKKDKQRELYLRTC